VNPTTISRLLELNRQFYQDFALSFSATRRRLQPGVRKVVEQFTPTAKILDLGCGNGELARELSHRGHSGDYTGLDFSAELLEQARIGVPANFCFQLADLSCSGWDAQLKSEFFDYILAFAVLHHLPGIELRLQILQKVRSLLRPGGRFVHSEWQFLNSPRMVARIQPWGVIGLAPSDIDDGDYLLDWRQGGHGLRYVHYFTEDELASLANAAGFEITESYLCDGENSRLGLYQAWR
jgi:tRNA (uracil-5-)-methyltransferase TRM9